MIINTLTDVKKNENNNKKNNFTKRNNRNIQFYKKLIDSKTQKFRLQRTNGKQYIVHFISFEAVQRII